MDCSEHCLLVREVAGILEVSFAVTKLSEFSVCARGCRRGICSSQCVEAACVGLGPCLWLEESWELREGQ